MSRERLYLFDTTLRDGAQTNGVDFTLHDKQIIANMLDDLGIVQILDRPGGQRGRLAGQDRLFSRPSAIIHLLAREPFTRKKQTNLPW